MAKYKLTYHGKVRYRERVDNKNTIDNTVARAKKYGLRIADIPVEYKKERTFIGHNKICYEDKIYVFAGNSYNTLITVYNNNYEVLRNLFIEKEVSRKFKEEILKKDKFTNKVISVKNELYYLTYKKNKVVSLEVIEFKNKQMKLIFSIEKDKISKLINQYMDGKQVFFEPYIDLNECNNIDKMVYHEVMKIPYGKTITYKELAKKINMKISVQGLVKSLNRCKLLFMIPTHRVIRSDGKPGSFCGKVSIKKQLLKLERENKIEYICNEVVEKKNDFCLNLGSLLVK